MDRYCRRLVREALAEDIGQEDVTTNRTVPANARCTVYLAAKQAGVLSGIEVFRTAFECTQSDIRDWWAMADGARFMASDVIARFNGAARAVLTAERTALNFVQRLSGVATLTAQYVAEVQGLNVRVCDTRKTTPLMRALEKAAVVHGGGANHRHTLFDGILIKENHIVGAGGIAHAVRHAREGAHHLLKIEVEVTTLDELDEALAAGADVIMLDNMFDDEMQAAVRKTAGKPVVLEASGNMSLDRIRSVAELGIPVISVGALTHSAPAVDMSVIIMSV